MREAGTKPVQGRIGSAFRRARKPDKDRMEALRLRAPWWWVFGVLFALAAYQILMNPFGFSDLTQRYTQDISEVLITGPYLYPETGRDRVSVALVEDSTLRDTAMPWPWPYGAQARILDALLAYKPRAVVVDLLFVDPRQDPTLPDLVAEIGRYRKAGVPLYFAAADGEPPVRTELRQAGVKLVDPTILVNQGIVRQYPITGRCFGKQAAGASCPSLALAVYRDLYPKQPLKVSDQGLMELVWGTRTDPTNAKWMRVIDEMGVARSCSETMSPWRRTMLAFFDPSQVRSRCPYTGTIPAESLMQGAEDPDVAHLARGRVVFYGASLEGVEDKSFTPVNGLIASVYVHAMALDNLITFHGKPEQNVAQLGGFTFDSNPIQVLAIVPVLLILSWLHVRGLRRRALHAAGKNKGGGLGEWLFDKVAETAWHWFALALGLGAGLLLTVAAGLSVANWVEVMFVSVELAALLLVGVPDAIWGYLHHVVSDMELQAGEQAA